MAVTNTKPENLKAGDKLKDFFGVCMGVTGIREFTDNDLGKFMVRERFVIDCTVIKRHNDKFDLGTKRQLTAGTNMIEVYDTLKEMLS